MRFLCCVFLGFFTLGYGLDLDLSLEDLQSQKPTPQKHEDDFLNALELELNPSAKQEQDASQDTQEIIQNTQENAPNTPQSSNTTPPKEETIPQAPQESTQTPQKEAPQESQTSQEVQNSQEVHRGGNEDMLCIRGPPKKQRPGRARQRGGATRPQDENL